MKIIISPAMKMKVDQESFPVRSTPQFLREAGELAAFLKQCSAAELQQIWQSSARTTKEGCRQLEVIDLTQTTGLTPAVISYSGIQYQYMAADLFTTSALDYLQENVRILSGLYGVLRPFDGVWPYRLEMKNKAAGFREPNLYKFWGSRLADNLFSEDNVVVNLASKEYSQSIAPYATGSRQLLNVIFQEEKNGQWKTVGVHAKMARGEMTRFIAERGLTAPEQLQDFNDFGFEYDSAVSTPSAYVFRTKFDFKRR